MKKLFIQLNILILFFLFNISCIDRDTIAGTGKETADKIFAVSGNLQFGIIGNKLTNPLVVRVFSTIGNPVRGVKVEFSFDKGIARFSDTIATTNGDGYAQTYVILGTKADSIRVFASVLGLKGSPVKFSLYAAVSILEPTQPKIKLVDGDNQTGGVGTTLSKPLKVRVSDLYDNPIPNTWIYFSTNNGNVQPTATMTDSSGEASTVWTLDTIAGSQKALAMLPSISNGTITFHAEAMIFLIPSYFTRVSKDTVVMLEGTTARDILVVKVLDQYRNPIYLTGLGRFYVKFTVTKGTGDIFPYVTFTNSDGDAAVSVYSDPGPLSSIWVKASVGFNLPDLDFVCLTYKSLVIDSLKSSNGGVTLYWQKNLNPYFANYTLQRSDNFDFDTTPIDVKIISNENTISTDDNTAVVGSTPRYRIKVNYSNGFYFYSNILEIAVRP